MNSKLIYIITVDMTISWWLVKRTRRGMGSVYIWAYCHLPFMQARGEEGSRGRYD
jgi:hypothetical protein